MINKIKNQNGFVLVEFVIALPLLILLVYALAQMVIQTSKLAKTQAADYVLQSEAQEILSRITSDARTAQSAEVRQAVAIKNLEIYEIFFNYRAVKNSNSAIMDLRPAIMDLRVPRRYTVGATANHGYQVYAERLKSGPKVNPISGGNFFGDTTVTELKFSQPSKNVLHITLELQSISTDRKLKINTSVFMPSCEKIEFK